MSDDSEYINKDASQSADADERRQIRHRRHVKEQVVSTFILLLFIGIVAFGVFMLVSAIIRYIPRNLFSGGTAAVADTAAATESSVQESLPPVTLEAPETESSVGETQVDYLEEVVGGYLADMTLEDKVSGLFIVTPEQLTGASRAQKAGDLTKEALSKYRVGGFLYSEGNVSDREQLTALISDTSSMSEYPLFFFVEEEGGKHSPVSSKLSDVTDPGVPGEIGASGDAEQALNAGRSMGSYLKGLGFNMDIAPVADLATENAGSENRERTYGSDTAQTSEMVTSVINGLQTEGLGACVKYFPGEGEFLGKDSSSVIEKTREEIESTDLLPFEAAVNCGVSAVMISNMRYSAFDKGEVPASLSKEVMNDLLRQKLGFSGLIVTGDLSDKAISREMGSGDAAVAALKAGADLIMTPKNFEEAYNAVLEAVKSGDIKEESVDESLDRIYRIKCGFEMSGLEK